MLFLVLLSAAVSVDLTLAVYETVCYGADFAIKITYHPPSTVVTFTPAPSTMGPNRVLFKNNMVQDPRYQWKYNTFVVPEVTESDAGKYVVYMSHHVEYDRKVLTVKDCEKRVYHLFYGNDLELALSENAAGLYFSLQDSPSHSELLWNKTDPGMSRGGRGRVRGRSWLLDKVIHSDQGYYTQRTREGRFITRNLVFVSVKKDSHSLSPGDHLTLPLQIPRSEIQLYFTSDKDLIRRQLVRDGRVLNPGSNPTGRLRFEEGQMHIADMQSYDGGMYMIQDKKGNSVYSVELEVVEEKRLFRKYLPYVGLAIVAFLFCTCIRSICCKKKPAPPAVPKIYGEDSSPTYPLAPSVQSQHPWEGSFTRIQKVGGKKKTLSSDCLHSSDSGIQFEFGKGGKNKDYFSTLPLNSDKPETSIVYTSDKLNFL